jgi:hypothetical protein
VRKGRWSAPNFNALVTMWLLSQFFVLLYDAKVVSSGAVVPSRAAVLAAIVISKA